MTIPTPTHIANQRPLICVLLATAPLQASDLPKPKILALNHAVKYVKIALLLNGQHLPSIQLLILCLSALKQYNEALALCETAL
ncbi:unnamed protein product, partial [Oppiella nova]